LTVLDISIVALIALNLALPTIVRDYVNRRLSKIPGYRGEVVDIDIHLASACTVRDAHVVRTSGKVPVPFFSSPTRYPELEGAREPSLTCLGCSSARQRRSFAITRRIASRRGRFRRQLGQSKLQHWKVVRLVLKNTFLESRVNVREAEEQDGVEVKEESHARKPKSERTAAAW
jgi:hypothetical protein